MGPMYIDKPYIKKSFVPCVGHQTVFVGEIPAMELWGIWAYPFITIIPWFSLIPRGGIY